MKMIPSSAMGVEKRSTNILHMASFGRSSFFVLKGYIMQEKPHFKCPVQTAPALQAATGIDRSLFSRGANNGLFGEAAYRSQDTWLFDTSHTDFDKWYQAHWQQPRVKGSKKVTSQ